MTLRFTEDERRAFGNALDRAAIEVSEGDPLDDEDPEAYLNNQRDVETAKRLWERIRRELLPEPLRACVVVAGELTCPNGHSGDIEHQEQQWERRSVLGIEGGVLKIEGASRTIDNAMGDEVLFCCDCGEDFDFPAGVRVEYV